MSSPSLTPGQYLLICRWPGLADHSLRVEVTPAGMVIPPSGYPQDIRTFGPEYSFVPVGGAR